MHRFELNNQENEEQIHQKSYKGEKASPIPHAKPTIQMFKECNLSLTSP